MRIIVCGGRHFNDAMLLQRTLDEIDARTPITHITHGAARGADQLAGAYAEANSIPCKAYPAIWRNGPAAGKYRNYWMLHNALGEGLDLVVAFPGGRGTAHMVRVAHRAGVNVLEL